jgi:hypothetical protein
MAMSGMGDRVEFINRGATGVCPTNFVSTRPTSAARAIIN